MMTNGRWPLQTEFAIRTEIALQTEAIRHESKLKMKEKDDKVEKLKTELEKKSKKYHDEKKKLHELIQRLTVALSFEKYGTTEVPDQSDEKHEDTGRFEKRDKSK